MHIKLNVRICKVLSSLLMGVTALSLCIVAGGSPVALAQEAVTSEHGAYYTINTVALSNGTLVDEFIIKGLPAPPPGFEVERQAVSLPKSGRAAGIRTLTVPSFKSVFGCSAVCGAMIAGYYDRTGFPNMYAGPANGGVMPLNDISWPTWSDGFATYSNCPLVASQNGVDGRTTQGSIDDYWVSDGSADPDPYVTKGWPQHIWGTAIGDYMKTSQSEFGNRDGWTAFWNYTNSSSRLTCSEMAAYSLINDGTLGRKQFYEARGYVVAACYNQRTDNQVAGGFSFAQFKAEIDAGRPVMLNLAGHTVVGVGYDDAMRLAYIHDTWDYNNHTMYWGTSYAGMELQSVSIVNIRGLPENPENMVVSGSNLYVDSGGSGLWLWNGAAWSQLSSANPESMVFFGSNLYVDFGGSGLWLWNDATWSQLTSANPERMVVSGSNLYVGFGGSGLWLWNGAAWRQLSGANPERMVVSGSSLYVDFGGSGLWLWNGVVWRQLSGANPESMVVSGSNLYVDFGGSGIWMWNGVVWRQLTGADAENMVVSGSNLYVDFGGSGIWLWNGAAWRQLSGANPENMEVSGSNLYVDFGGSGLWLWNGAAWRQLSGANPENMVVSGSNLYVDFGGSGIWMWNGAVWSQP